MKRRLRRAAVRVQNWWESRDATANGIILVCRDRHRGVYVLEIGIHSRLRRRCHLSLTLTPAELRDLAKQATEVLDEDAQRAERNNR